MASVPQSSWFCTLSSAKNSALFSSKSNPRNCTFKTLKVSSFSNADSSQAEPSDSTEHGEMDPVKLAFARAKAYKKSVQSNPVPKILQNPPLEDLQPGNETDSLATEVVNDGGNDEVPLHVKIAMEKAKEYKKNKEIVLDSGAMDQKSRLVSDTRNERSTSDVKNEDNQNQEIRASVKLSMEKAKEYKKNKEIISSSSGIAEKSEIVSDTKNDGVVSDITNDGNQELPASVKLAMEKAREYKKNKGLEGSKTITGLKGKSGTNSGNVSIEQMDEKTKELTISSIDFVGLDFAEKKSSRGPPPGLLPLADSFPEGDSPEVEILVGDTSKFGNATVSKPESKDHDKLDMYKPKVSTWGVFPRPSNISKTYGGGRNIRPGEALETAEDKAAKEARTGELLAAYRRKVGLNIDPQLKFECEEALKDGDSLMDLGKLSQALPFYEKVMDKLTFQSELHGLAALKWSICQDSLTRPNEARAMYEKLQSHPNVEVSKKAKQFLFSFQAMEMMKIKKTNNSPMNTGYQNYFEAFIEDKSNYSVNDADAEVEVGMLSQAFPYIIFLVSPVIIVLLIAVRKGI